VTGPATMPAASGEGRPAAFGWGLSGSHPFGRRSLTLPRPGEQRKDTCPAADPLGEFGGFKVSRSHPIAVVRRPFPEPRVGQMEFF
jgi:hypothetical protein